MTCQVIVIGAGIIGMSAANYLQRSGVKVTVFDVVAHWAHLRAPTDRLVVEFVTGKEPCVDPAPYNIFPLRARSDCLAA